jgi:16S rRNA (guanine(527)-N(7))-methyltransferase RsmG
VFHVKHSPADEIRLALEAEERLRAFVDLLRQWNRRINLVGQADERPLWERHILDSAQLVPLLPAPEGELIDLGSGAGFPGLVLALTTNWRVALVEADQRKAAFLREAVRATGARATVYAVRAEQVSLPPARVVTARALAPLPDLLALATPLLAPDGICLFPKGRSAEDELTAARAQWHMRVERFPSRTNPTATLLRLSEIRRATSP